MHWTNGEHAAELKRARAEERERCAKVAEEFNERVGGPGYRDTKLAIARKIRELK